MKILLFMCGALICVSVLGQNSSIDLENFAERLFQIQDQAISYEDLYESLLVHYANKLNLNQASFDELSSLYILSTLQLQDFFQHKEEFGDFISINELQSIPSFDRETIDLLLPFVTIDDPKNYDGSFIKRVIKEENNYFLLRYSRRLEPQKGYSLSLPDTSFVVDEFGIPDTTITYPSRYIGSQDKIYGRFRTSSKDDFSIGFTFEKDNGEEISFNRTQSGFDFYSYHILLENKLGFDKLLLGDFQLQSGQGVVFGAGFSAGKGAETVTTTKRNTLGLRPYTSALETGFFSGLAFTKSFLNLELTGFYSLTNQDGTIQIDTTFTDFDEYINGIQSSGYHRTPSELEAKHNITERSFGGMLIYRPSRKFQLGISGIDHHYSSPLLRKATNYNQFEFRGDHNLVYSVFSTYYWQNFSFFGEVAQSKSGGIGGIGGFIASLSPTIDLSVTLRNYAPDFHSFYGNALSENSRNINEKGIYWGISILPTRHYRINAYYDRFKFPWLKYQTEAPSDGFEWLLRHTYTPSKTVNIYGQIRQQSKQISQPNENQNILINQVKTNLIFNIGYTPGSNLTFKTKVQSSNQKEGNEITYGFAIIQDVNFSVWKLQLNTRMALFETDNFDNAQYVYENDVLYAFSIPAYYGSGIRNYVMMRFDPVKDFTLWVRYSRFTFKDRQSIGSGLETSSGNKLSEIKLMIRYTI